MKCLSESIIDDKLNNYLLFDLQILLELYKQQIFPVCNITNNLLFESLSQLDNLKELYNEIADYIAYKIPKDFEDGSKFTIDVSKAKSCFKYVTLTIYKKEYLIAAYVKSDDKVCLELSLPDDEDKFLSNRASALILHELLHAYEDYQRKVNGKPSIFDELTNEYRNAFQYINSKHDTIKQLATLKYFFNDKERRAYISTLEIDIENVVKKYKDLTLINFKPSKILEKLKKESIWKVYFDFGKFVLNDINNIDDEELEKAYYRVTNIKDKSANKIRKECRNIFEKFNKKFSTVFLKVLGNFIEKNTNVYF